MRALRLQLIALLALVAVLLASGASASSQYLCHMTGHVVATCCCAVEGSPHPTRARQSARPADCCERLVSAAGPGAAGTRDASASIPGAALLAVLPLHDVALPQLRSAVAVILSVRAPLAVGPPLFVTHCAYLI